MNDEPEAMARVCYDFPSQSFPGVRIKGAVEVREGSRAKSIVESLNAEYGEGTHWVEMLNYTYAERISDVLGEQGKSQ